MRVELLCAAIEPNISSCSGKNVNRRLSSSSFGQMPSTRVEPFIASERRLASGGISKLQATVLTGTVDRIPDASEELYEL